MFRPQGATINDKSKFYVTANTDKNYNLAILSLVYSFKYRTIHYLAMSKPIYNVVRMNFLSTNHLVT